jgi:hypothetical protein
MFVNVVNAKPVTRKDLADKCLGMSYEERLRKSKCKPVINNFFSEEIIEDYTRFNV